MISTIEPLTDMRALCQTKARLHRLMAALQAPECDREDIAAALVRLFVTEYQPALDDMRAATDPALLASRLQGIATRLERGIAVEGDAANALFKRLLLELEVLSDVLAAGYTDGGQTPLAVLLDRINDWQAH